MSDEARPPVREKRHFLVFGAPLIEEEEIAEVVASLRSGWLGTGPKVARFEDAFRAFKGTGHTAAVNSCTAALHLAAAHRRAIRAPVRRRALRAAVRGIASLSQ